MSTDPFSGVLDPFAWWDVSATYEKYYGFIDLVVYCTIFIALAQAVFGGRFTGRPGKAMATALGMGLGIALAAAEQHFGWNLRQAGPIAALLGLLLLGFLLMQTMLRINISWTIAAPLTYIIIYLFIRAISPVLMSAISQKAPFVHFLAAVMLIICVWRIGVAIWPHSEVPVDHHGTDADMIASLDRPREKHEFRLVKNMKRHLAPEAKHETIKIEHNLEALRRELGKPSPNWQSLGQACSNIAHKADDAIQLIDRIRTLDRRIRNFDLHELAQLRSYYDQLPEPDRVKLRQQIILERKKIIEEHAVDRLADECEHRHQEFRRVMDSFGQATHYKDRNAAQQALNMAISLEEQQKDEIRRLIHAEKLLLHLTRRKLREEKLP